MRTWNYTYDSLGNLIAQEGAGGELITDGDYYREYNALHQLTKVRKKTATGKIIEEYSYGPDGERIMTVNYLTNTTIYTPFREWMMIVNRTGTYNYTYIYDGNTLVARLNPDGTKWFYHDDHLGSTSLITDQDGNIVEETFYNPFGQVTSGGEREAYLLYTNQMKDAIGCYDYGARVYCPKWYHFTSADALIVNVYTPQSLNHYAYVQNNPYLYVDPTGMYEEDVHYELTRYLALQTGFTVDQAEVIAHADQGVDDNSFTSPFNPFATREYHFQPRDVAESRVEAAILNGDLADLGTAMHTLQDSFSHEDYLMFAQHASGQNRYGEWDPHAPDKTYDDPLKADAMAFETFAYFGAYQGWNAKKIITTWREDVYPTVYQFNRATDGQTKTGLLTSQSSSGYGRGSYYAMIGNNNPGGGACDGCGSIDKSKSRNKKGSKKSGSNSGSGGES